MSSTNISKGFDVFELRDNVINNYKDFARSFTEIKSDDIKEKIDRIYENQKYWPEPLIQINPNYKVGANIRQLVKEKILHEDCNKIFAIKGEPLTLYKHQVEAITIANEKRGYIVTTGTGSGKSLCFFIPIVSFILKYKETDKKPKTRAYIF